jgi:hypothetical protein
VAYGTFVAVVAVVIVLCAMPALLFRHLSDVMARVPDHGLMMACRSAALLSLLLPIALPAAYLVARFSATSAFSALIVFATFAGIPVVGVCVGGVVVLINVADRLRQVQHESARVHAESSRPEDSADA